MSKGVNKVIIVGRLGGDPEVRFTPQCHAVANFTVATSENWKDQQGNKQEKTEWHRIVLYRKLAEIAGQYIRKGSNVYLEGKLQTREWQDQQGQKRYTTEIVCHEMQMLDSKPQGGNQQQVQQQAPQRQQQVQQYQQQPQNNAYAQQRSNPPAQNYQSDEPPFDFDSDIPFN